MASYKSLLVSIKFNYGVVNYVFALPRLFTTTIL